MWESDLKYIDSESLYFYFNVSRGKYYYFDYEKQWYKTKMDILPDILGIPSVMLDGHKEFFTAKKSWHELWSGIITKM